MTSDYYRAFFLLKTRIFFGQKKKHDIFLVLLTESENESDMYILVLLFVRMGELRCKWVVQVNIIFEYYVFINAALANQTDILSMKFTNNQPINCQMTLTFQNVWNFSPNYLISKIFGNYPPLKVALCFKQLKCIKQEDH